MNYHSGRGWREVNNALLVYRFDPAAFPGIVFYMATHKYVANIKGGYFYRFYPKLPKTVTKSKDEETQGYLFDMGIYNPGEDITHANTRTEFHGQFIDRIIEKDRHIIILLCQCEYFITDLGTRQQEQRTLSSTIHIHVPVRLYNYDFEKNKIYSITLDEIIEL